MIWEGCYLQASKITFAGLLLPPAASIRAEARNEPFLPSCDTVWSITEPHGFLACIHLVSMQCVWKEITDFFLRCLQSSHIISATAWVSSNLCMSRIRVASSIAWAPCLRPVQKSAISCIQVIQDPSIFGWQSYSFEEVCSSCWLQVELDLVLNLQMINKCHHKCAML